MGSSINFVSEDLFLIGEVATMERTAKKKQLRLKRSEKEREITVEKTYLVIYNFLQFGGWCVIFGNRIISAFVHRRVEHLDLVHTKSHALSFPAATFNNLYMGGFRILMLFWGILHSLAKL